MLKLLDTFCILQLPTNMKGGNGKVAYIDTEGTLYLLYWFFSLIYYVTLFCVIRLQGFLYVLWFSLNRWNCSRPDRIIPIAERFGMDAGAVLDNVKPFSSLIHQYLIICFQDSDYILIGIVKDHIRSCLYIWASIQPASRSSSKNGWRAFQAVGKLYLAFFL